MAAKRIARKRASDTGHLECSPDYPSPTPVRETLPPVTVPNDVDTPGKSPFRGRPMYDLPHVQSKSSLLRRAEEVNLRGFMNLMGIVVVAQNARLVIENFLKYGVLVKFIPTRATLDMLLNQWPILMSFFMMHLILLGSFVAERYISDSRPAMPLSLELLVMKTSLVLAMILVPQAGVQMHTLDPVFSTVLLLFAITWALKIWSFHHTLYDLRLAREDSQDLQGLCGSDDEYAAVRAYPASLTLSSFYSYMLMPTVCYQLTYPRTPRVCWLFVLKSVVQALTILVLMKIIVEQYIMKTVENTFLQINLETMTRARVISILLERLLKLSIPTLIIWLLLFFVLFHHWLNILAEVTRFGDRAFYSDWWNCSSFGEYWQKWNLPIHNFAQRHLNKPMLRRRVHPLIASNIVFLISAILHEYLVVIPLGFRWNGLVCFAFMLQVPLMILTKQSVFKKNSVLGNTLFWITFCFSGQPLALMVFYCMWAAGRGSKEPIAFQEQLNGLLKIG